MNKKIIYLNVFICKNNLKSIHKNNANNKSVTKARNNVIKIGKDFYHILYSILCWSSGDKVKST